ncbi:major capsid protein [Allobranchiibius sp. GilTou73]|uniref:major capsid protein n=1 Tax=Allobranchiibius sp. GilTou73 TaxID=2904523 RepID=UPI001F4912AF|nr:major capsid protein [Allobranchiibius sp. GilTou73]UIJ33365.1 major capsid protein [Allobranchiibius sp. GilTou73]
MRVMRAVRDVIDAEGADGAEALLSSLVTPADAPPAAPSLGAAAAQVRGHRVSSPAPQGGTGARGSVLTASGAAINDSAGLATAFGDAVAAARRDRAGNYHSVARASYEYPEDRTLDAMDSGGNTAKLDALLNPAAMVASGGICGPVDVDFSVPVLTNESRPLKDGLPTFAARRGGVRYLTTPSLASSNAASATGIWTEAADANPGGATKPVLTISCGAETEVFVDAVPTRIQLGNLQARFSPEWVDGIIGLAMTAAARTAELNLLGKISAGSTTVSSGQLLGAARDFLGTVDAVVAGIRYRHRLADGHPVTVLLPVWIQNLIRSDLVREMAHGGEITEAWDLTVAQIEGLLAARGAQAIWLQDGPAAATVGGIAVPAQTFGAQSAGSLLDFPKTVAWQAFPAGSWVALEGGRLDVNVVRDSTLNATNQLETFVETFEGVAYRGVESLEVISTVRANGLSAGTVNTSTY